MTNYFPSFEEERGYVHLADYCMIAPSADDLTDSQNGITGCGS